MGVPAGLGGRDIVAAAIKPRSHGVLLAILEGPPARCPGQGAGRRGAIGIRQENGIASANRASARKRRPTLILSRRRSAFPPFRSATGPASMFKL